MHVVTRCGWCIDVRRTAPANHALASVSLAVDGAQVAGPSTRPSPRIRAALASTLEDGIEECELWTRSDERLGLRRGNRSCASVSTVWRRDGGD